MPTPLVLRHLPKTDPPQLQVMEGGGRATEPRPVPPADRFPVEGRPDSHLMRELRWYLEDFLGYPFSPETEHAERVLAALDAWGREAFGALFGDREGGAMLDRATRDGHAAMRLQLWSDDPRVLSWPWEALDHPQYGPLGQLVQIERRLDRVGDPPALSAELPRDGVNILLVTARPYEDDVRYRSISRPLVELVHHDRHLPADVHVLRPPTFDRLREHLRERRDAPPHLRRPHRPPDPRPLRARQEREGLAPRREAPDERRPPQGPRPEAPRLVEILPLWFGVDLAEVKSFSPNLANKVALRINDTPESIQQAALAILEQVRPDLFGKITRRRALMEAYATATTEGLRTDQLSTLKVPDGPIFQEDLEDSLLLRIRLVRACLADVDPTTFKEWIRDFRREPKPYTEMMTWEYIAAVYMELTRRFPLKLRHRLAIYIIVLESVTFVDDLSSRHAPLWKILPSGVRAFLQERMKLQPPFDEADRAML